MDRIIKTTLCILILILIGFVAIISYGITVEQQYKDSFAGTYNYTCTITTDGVISNVTFFLPVPSESKGNSPLDGPISAQQVSGLPADWTVTLFDAGKTTLVKVSAPKIGEPAANGTVHTRSVTLTVNGATRTPIDTASPLENAAVFRPVQDLRKVDCPATAATAGDTPKCYQYLTSTYADYTSSPMASVTISATLDATNSWTVFQQPAANSYQNTLYVLIQGENHGWVTTRGELESGIGTYQVPGLTP